MGRCHGRKRILPATRRRGSVQPWGLPGELPPLGLGSAAPSHQPTPSPQPPPVPDLHLGEAEGPTAPYTRRHLLPPLGDSNGAFRLLKTPPGATLLGSLWKTALLEKQTQTHFSEAPTQDPPPPPPGPGRRWPSQSPRRRGRIPAQAARGPWRWRRRGPLGPSCRLIRAIIRLGLQDGAVRAFPPLAQGRVGAGPRAAPARPQLQRSRALGEGARLGPLQPSLPRRPVGYTFISRLPARPSMSRWRWSQSLSFSEPQCLLCKMGT